MAEEKPKFERTKRAGDKEGSSSDVAAPQFDLQAKIESIVKSEMPEAQKQAYLRELGVVEEAIEGIAFNVYAALKKIPAWKHQAMKLYPKAVGVESVSLQAWDEIFKDF